MRSSFPTTRARLLAAIAVALSLLTSLLTSFAPTSATAQSTSTLVVPVSVGSGPEGLFACAADAAAALDGIPGDELRQRITTRLAPDAPGLATDALDRWHALGQLAVRHLAHGEHDAAMVLLGEADALSDGLMLELNRDPLQARHVLDACLYGVRARLEASSEESATAHALECRRRAPSAAPTAYRHPPEVLDILRRIDARLTAQRSTALLVNSDPQGCAVRVQGAEMGRTPFSIGVLAPGEYSVQVECGEARGRVHRLRVGAEPVSLEIAARFERALRTDRSARLEYANEAELEHRVSDALRLARLADATDLWLLTAVGTEEIEVVRLDVSVGEPIHSTIVGLERVREAIDTIRQGGRTTVETEPQPRAEADAAAQAPPPTEIPEHGSADERIAGATLGGVALGGFVTAWSLFAARVSYGPALERAAPTAPEFIPDRDAWLNLRYAIWSVAGAASALGVASISLLVQRDADVIPWWSWALGGVGVIGTVAGIVEMATSSPCPDDIDHGQACVDRAASLDRGAIIVAMSAPVIAVPVVHAVRGTLGEHAVISVRTSATGARVELSGAF